MKLILADVAGCGWPLDTLKRNYGIIRGMEKTKAVLYGAEEA